MSDSVTKNYTEFSTFKTESQNEDQILNATVTMEYLQARIESAELYKRIDAAQTLFSTQEGQMQEKFTKFIKESPDVGPSPEERQKEKEETEVAMDRKVEAAFEKLRKDNQFIWKESLELAEKEFSQKGVGESMDFLPKLLMNSDDLKRTVNTLLVEEDSKSKPLILPGPPTNKVLFEGPLPSQADLDAVKQPLPTTPKAADGAPPSGSAAANPDGIQQQDPSFAAASGQGSQQQPGSQAAADPAAASSQQNPNPISAAGGASQQSKQPGASSQ
jgi:hypothetical protein